jgi:hypothetical protein
MPIVSHSTATAGSHVAKARSYDKEYCIRFACAAEPYRWLESANNLHTQAVVLRECSGDFEPIYSVSRRRFLEYNLNNRATFLLCTFAIENAIKAFLIYEHPSWVSSGYLSHELRSHQLVQLSEKSTLIPFRARDQWILESFEEGNATWMRYPCGLSIDDTMPERIMQGRLWNAYIRMMRGYGRKLVRLIGKVGWDQPYGERSTWVMQGSWLGSPAP